MDCSTTYLGLALPHPLVVGASPLADDLDMVRRLEDAGAAAIVLRSLFAEEVAAEQMAADRHFEEPAGSFAEALSYLPDTDVFGQEPEAYLEKIRRTKAAVGLPVLASLNGTTLGEWLDLAAEMAGAGADALELNLYHVAADPAETAEDVEARFLDMVRRVKTAARVPLAVKLGPSFTVLSRFARRLADAGADGLVLFNRFYEPDIDVETLEVERRLELSTSSELLLRLHWLAILSGRVPLSLAASGGVHGTLDAVKAVMCGAHAVQMVSALLRHGPARLAEVRTGLARWLEEHEYESLRQMQGSMGLERCPDPNAYFRLNYAEVLRSWR
jgi:dihydroorotate dehydrogenase (fumarate)